jgi:hypothetical protein
MDVWTVARQVFDTVGEVQDQATRWMWYYNYEGSNMALDGIASISGWPWAFNATSNNR